MENNIDLFTNMNYDSFDPPKKAANYYGVLIVTVVVVAGAAIHFYMKNKKTEKAISRLQLDFNTLRAALFKIKEKPKDTSAAVVDQTPEAVQGIA